MNNDMGQQAFGFGPTYRVKFPNDQYDPKHDEELKKKLRAALAEF
jgi:hypothetical protein